MTESSRHNEIRQWTDLLADGLRYSRDGLRDKALSCFEAAYAQRPERPEAACALGRELWKQGALQEAAPLLAQAWSDKQLLSAGISLARCLGLDMQHFDEAYGVLAQVEETFPEEDCVPLIRAEILLAEGRLDEAATIAHALLRMGQTGDSSNNAASLLLARVENARGMASCQNGSFDRGIFHFKRAGDLDVEWAIPLNNLGVAFERLAKWQRAEVAYRAACHRNPRYARAWHNIALLQRRRGAPDCLSSFKRAFSLEPRRPEIAIDLAIALADAQSAEQARQVLQTHVQALGGLVDSWRHLMAEMKSRNVALLEDFCCSLAQETS